MYGEQKILERKYFDNTVTTQSKQHLSRLEFIFCESTAIAWPASSQEETENKFLSTSSTFLLAETADRIQSGVNEEEFH